MTDYFEQELRREMDQLLGKLRVLAHRSVKVSLLEATTGTARRHGILPSLATADPTDQHQAELAALLVESEPIDTLIERLNERYGDPTLALLSALGRDARSPAQRGHLDRKSLRAIEALLALNTVESLGYLVKHVAYLCWTAMIDQHTRAGRAGLPPRTGTGPKHARRDPEGDCHE